MPEAYMGQFLHVNLNEGTTKTLPLPQWLKEDFIGGKGFGARLLYDLLPRGTDALAPENVLMFMTGPLTGTLAPSMRACIVTKSPLTGTYLDSFFGGHLGPEIKYAGYDGIVIVGRASEPVYLWIDDDMARLVPAGHIWGLDALEANAAIKEELGDASVKIASIGQGGENLVRYALVSCEYNRQAGRGGAGAVMGSKNLKAVVLRGTRPVAVNDPEAFGEAVAQANVELDASEDVQALKTAGTAFAVEFSNEAGLFPYKNYSDGVDARAALLGEPGQARHLWLGSAACMGCPIRCSKMGAVRTGRYKGTVTDIVEYESAALMGANLDIHDVRAVAHLVKLCDRLGLDSMSAGSAVAFAMEAAEKGIITAPQDVDLKFGNVEAAEHLIQAIANRQGELGNLLAEGVKRASKILGGGSEDFAVHVKGLESPAWGPRGAPAMGLALMTADRGGCHQRALPLIYEVTELEWEGKPVERLAVEGKARIVYALQNYLAGTDTLVKCDFGGFGIQPETYARLLGAATGREAKPDLFDEVGERIWSLTRLFNLREGIDPREDRLPRRFVEEPLPSGPAKGHRISESDMEVLRLEYYQVRGWSETGHPTPETLQRLRLDPERKFQIESGL